MKNVTQTLITQIKSAQGNRKSFPKKESSTSNLSKITTKDQVLLQKTVEKFKPHSNNYEDSWGYIIQATRYAGFKWYDTKTGSLIFFGHKSLTDNTLVVPTFFATIPYLKSTLDKIIKSTPSSQIIIKNVNPSEIGNYKAYGFRPYDQHECWSERARFDDQTYPQLVVDIKKTILARGKAYHQLRRILNKNPRVTLRKYTESDRDDISIILTLKDRSTPNAMDQGVGIYYSSHIMYLAADIEKYVLTNNTTGEILGFLATSDISSTHTTLVASIFKPGVKVSSVWGIYQILKMKHNKGFTMINLGGLETEGSFTFLSRTFRPVDYLPKTHLVYTPPI